MYRFMLVLCFSLVEGRELLGNHDFENGNSISPWQCQDCHATITTSDRYHGAHGVTVSDRHHNWAGLTQSFSLTGGHDYHCSAYIKILTLAPGKAYADVVLMLKYNNGNDHYDGIGQNKYIMADGTFWEIGGDFHIPRGVNQAHMFVQISDVSVNYVLDNASCQQIHHDPNWRTHANQRIENIRKGTLHINLSGSGDSHGLSVQIVQKKSQFGLGTAFKAAFVTDTNHAEYQKFLFENFEWAVPENALKWKQMEWTKGHINYNRGMDAVKKLKSKGFKVRGHNMFWDDPRRIPSWLTGLSSTDALRAMHKRVNDMISHSMGTLEHWDVNNENLHNHPFEDMVHNPRVSEDMFKWIHNMEPGVKLFLNEFNVITYHQTTTALKALAQHYKSSGVPIHALGAQGHFGTSNLNLDVIKYRLDKIAEVGLPVWITELTIKETDANKKATALDNLMTLFFSHPAVEGVLLWGFWDGAIYDTDLALANGSGVTPNAAGQKWIELFHRTFRTNESRQFNGQRSVSARVFYGDYHLIFKQHGRIIHEENVSFTQGSKTVTVNL